MVNGDKNPGHLHYLTNLKSVQSIFQYSFQTREDNAAISQLEDEMSVSLSHYNL